MKGFTLIEIIVYIALSSFIVSSIMVFAWNMIALESTTRTTIEFELADIYYLQMKNI